MKKMLGFGALLAALCVLFAACDTPLGGSDIESFAFSKTSGLQEGADKAAAGAVAGSFTVTGGTSPYTYSLVAGNGDTDNTSFRIANANIMIGDTALTAKDYSARVRVTDVRGKTLDKPVPFTVGAAGSGITGFTFSATSGLREGDDNAKAGAVAGTLKDPVGGTSPYTYTLVTGEGAADNSLFTIDGVDLKIGDTALSAKDYSVRIQVADANETYAKAVSFTVLGVDDPNPEITGFTFTATSGLKEGADNAQAGAVAGTLKDPVGGTGPAFTYTLVTGEGDTDNGSFTIDGDKLKIGSTALSEKTYSVRIQAADSRSETFAQKVSIEVLAADAPDPEITGFIFEAKDGLQKGNANVNTGAVVGELKVTGGTAPFIYTFVSGANNNSSFEIVDAELKVGGTALNAGTYTVKVHVEDANGKTYTDAEGTVSVAAIVVTELDLSSLVTQPVKGVAQDTVFVPQTQYTGAIAWKESNGTDNAPANFAASTVYKAIVTLTAKEGYTFTGVTENSFSHSGATTVANAAGSGATITVTITFPATAAPDLSHEPFTSLTDMKTWLGEQVVNTASEPYYVKLDGVDINDMVGTGGTTSTM